jgi:hypothetical protein
MHADSVSQDLRVFPRPSVMTAVPKVLSAINVLAPLLFSYVRKPRYTLRYDRAIDIAHTQSTYPFEEYAPPTSVTNSY